MKLHKFIMGMLGAFALTACSSDEPENNGVVNPGDTDDDKYISVSISMPSASGSRADGDYKPDGSDPGNFNDGTEEESKVKNVVFFFFDDKDNCIDVLKLDNPTFTKDPEQNQNPAISHYGTVEARLKAGLTYKKVAVALNTNQSNANAFAEITNFQTLLEMGKDYAGQVAGDGSNQMMSNSVYFNTNGTPTPADKYILVAITANNIYTSAERPNIKMVAPGKKTNDNEREYVDIFVDRVAARVDVSKATWSMENYYVSMDKDGKKQTVSFYNPLDFKTDEVVVKPVIKGMCINVTAKTAHLIKQLDMFKDDGTMKFGYDCANGNGKGYNSFKWNDKNNRRSYWATTNSTTSSSDYLNYMSYNEAIENFDWSSTKVNFSRYINPNTQQYAPTQDNEEASNNTKVMVVAVLCENGDVNKPISFVRYGGDYMRESTMLQHAANLINKSVRNIDWSVKKLDDGTSLTSEQIAAIKASVSNAFKTGITSDKLTLGMLNTTAADKFGDADWEAKVASKTKEGAPDIEIIYEAYTLENLDGTLKTFAENTVKKEIANTLATINKAALYYWKEGRTYYFTNIKHQGFYGLVGGGTDNYLFGVVRNHIYRVNLNGVFGLGTPVIDPDKPINPDRPDDGSPSYIQARINILPWRVVTNEATVH